MRVLNGVTQNPLLSVPQLFLHVAASSPKSSAGECGRAPLKLLYSSRQFQQEPRDVSHWSGCNYTLSFQPEDMAREQQLSRIEANLAMTQGLRLRGRCSQKKIGGLGI